MQTRHTRLGFTLFFVYLVLYGGFMFVNAFAPSWMEWTPVAGLNLAILYGFGLILAALVSAVVYGIASGDSRHESKDQGVAP